MEEYQFVIVVLPDLSPKCVVYSKSQGLNYKDLLKKINDKNILDNNDLCLVTPSWIEKIKNFKNMKFSEEFMTKFPKYRLQFYPKAYPQYIFRFRPVAKEKDIEIHQWNAAIDSDSNVKFDDFLKAFAKTFFVEATDINFEFKNSSIKIDSPILSQIEEIKKNEIELSFSITDSEFSHAKKRIDVLKEIRTSEERYVTDLQKISENFTERLFIRYHIDSDVYRRTFKSVSDILPIHKSFLKSLQKIGSALETSIGPLFLEFIPYFKVAAPHVANFSSVIEEITDLVETNRSFGKEIFQICRSEFKGNTVESLLVTPVQRIPRYPLLLKELMKCVPDCHWDKEDIQLSFNNLTKLNQEIDQKTSEQKSANAMAQLQKKFGNSYKVLTGGRIIISTLNSEDNSLYLFNDLLLIQLKLEGSYKFKEFPLITTKVLKGKTDFTFSTKKNVFSFPVTDESQTFVENFSKTKRGFLLKKCTFDGSLRWSSKQCKGPPELKSAAIASILFDLYLFGGKNKEDGTVSNDLWWFHDDTWELVEVTNAPKPRYDCTMCVYGTSLVVFGGHDNDNNIFDDLLVFDIPTANWIVIDSKSNMKPSPRFAHAAAFLGSQLWIYGGKSRDTYFNDLYCFDFSYNDWWKITTPKTPEPRAWSTAFWIPEKILKTKQSKENAINLEEEDPNANDDEKRVSECGANFAIFGGVYKSATYRTIWMFDYDNVDWVEVETQGDQPTARFSHVSAQFYNSLYIIGGRSMQDNSLDPYRLDMTTKPYTWSVLPQSDEPNSFDNGACCVIDDFGLALYNTTLYFIKFKQDYKNPEPSTLTNEISMTKNKFDGTRLSWPIYNTESNVVTTYVDHPKSTFDFGNQFPDKKMESIMKRSEDGNIKWKEESVLITGSILLDDSFFICEDDGIQKQLPPIPDIPTGQNYPRNRLSTNIPFFNQNKKPKSTDHMLPRRTKTMYERSSLNPNAENQADKQNLLKRDSISSSASAEVQRAARNSMFNKETSQSSFDTSKQNDKDASPSKDEVILAEKRSKTESFIQRSPPILRDDGESDANQQKNTNSVVFKEAQDSQQANSQAEKQENQPPPTTDSTVPQPQQTNATPKTQPNTPPTTQPNQTEAKPQANPASPTPQTPPPMPQTNPASPPVSTTATPAVSQSQPSQAVKPPATQQVAASPKPASPTAVNSQQNSQEKPQVSQTAGAAANQTSPVKPQQVQSPRPPPSTQPPPKPQQKPPPSTQPPPKPQQIQSPRPPPSTQPPPKPQQKPPPSTQPPPKPQQKPPPSTQPPPKPQQIQSPRPPPSTQPPPKPQQKPPPSTQPPPKPQQKPPPSTQPPPKPQQIQSPRPPPSTQPPPKPQQKPPPSTQPPPKPQQIQSPRPPPSTQPPPKPQQIQSPRPPPSTQPPPKPQQKPPPSTQPPPKPQMSQQPAAAKPQTNQPTTAVKPQPATTATATKPQANQPPSTAAKQPATSGANKPQTSQAASIRPQSSTSSTGKPAAHQTQQAKTQQNQAAKPQQAAANRPQQSQAASIRPQSSTSSTGKSAANQTQQAKTQQSQAASIRPQSSTSSTGKSAANQAQQAKTQQNQAAATKQQTTAIKAQSSQSNVANRPQQNQQAAAKPQQNQAASKPQPNAAVKTQPSQSNVANRPQQNQQAATRPQQSQTAAANKPQQNQAAAAKNQPNAAVKTQPSQSNVANRPQQNQASAAAKPQQTTANPAAKPQQNQATAAKPNPTVAAKPQQNATAAANKAQPNQAATAKPQQTTANPAAKPQQNQTTAAKPNPAVAAKPQQNATTATNKTQPNQAATAKPQQNPATKPQPNAAAKTQQNQATANRPLQNQAAAKPQQAAAKTQQQLSKTQPNQGVAKQPQPNQAAAKPQQTQQPNKTQPSQANSANRPQQNSAAAINKPQANTAAQKTQQNLAAAKPNQNAAAQKAQPNTAASANKQNQAQNHPQQNQAAKPQQGQANPANKPQQNSAQAKQQQNQANKPQPNTAANKPQQNSAPAKQQQALAAKPQPNAANKPRQNPAQQQAAQNKPQQNQANAASKPQQNSAPAKAQPNQANAANKPQQNLAARPQQSQPIAAANRPQQKQPQNSAAPSRTQQTPVRQQSSATLQRQQVSQTPSRPQQNQAKQAAPSTVNSKQAASRPAAKNGGDGHQIQPPLRQVSTAQKVPLRSQAGQNAKNGAAAARKPAAGVKPNSSFVSTGNKKLISQTNAPQKK